MNYKQSKALRELRLDHCYLTGKDVAYLMHSMTEEPGKARDLYLDVSENSIEQYLDHLTTAIASGLAPSHLTIRLIEFEEENDFRQLMLALAINNTIRVLDISRASLPCEAEEETCQALEKMFAENKTLEYLDISGEDSRLETSKLGVGVNKALRGLQKNSTLRVLRIQCKFLNLLENLALTCLRSEFRFARCWHPCRCSKNELDVRGTALRKQRHPTVWIHRFSERFTPKYHADIPTSDARKPPDGIEADRRSSQADAG